MFYHALTGNGGTTPTEDLEPVLLWENSNPTSAFAAQTVSLDLSDYAGVLVECELDISHNDIITRAYIKKEDYDLVGFGAGSGGAGSATSAVGRTVKVDDNGVIFGNGYTTAVNNTASIPVKIYGVKGYVVEPIDSISVEPAKEFTTAGIDCEIGEYYQLMSSSPTDSFSGFSGADILIKYSSAGAYTIICKTTTKHINTGSSGSYCKIILNK